MTERTSRPKRETRGKRMKELIGEEKDIDDEFWGHGVWNDEDEEDFEGPTEVDGDDDSVDSDFDDPEQSQSEGDEEEKKARKQERVEIRKTAPKGYQDPKKKKPSERSTRATSSAAAAAAAAAITATTSSVSATNPYEESSKEKTKENKKSSNQTKRKEVITVIDEKKDSSGGPTTRTLRHSTRAKTIEITTVVEKQKKLTQEREAKKQKKDNQDDHKLTQEDLLAEAALTEQYNMAYLKKLQQLDADQKSKTIRAETERTGPYTTYYSKNGINTITFHNFDDLPESVKAPAVSYPKKPICVITGAPAKYIDPQSGLPFSTPEAFRAIRTSSSK
eukprot:c16500_g1_i2.p1 GENE.c16500_g1_i2~~c16500_g1_i2.p1  ORF type:complete len:334 (-),score=175.53 c16500_g1_i2:3-1004(-)